jgi:hypothetical protein
MEKHGELVCPIMEKCISSDQKGYNKKSIFHLQKAEDTHFRELFLD